MTVDKHFKRQVREEAKRTGRSYAATRALLLKARADAERNPNASELARAASAQSIANEQPPTAATPSQRNLA